MSRAGARRMAASVTPDSASVTASTCGSLAGKVRRGSAEDAPTTMTPALVALSISAASSGSLGPTRLRLMICTRADNASASACASVKELQRPALDADGCQQALYA